nr:MAG TPA: Site specific DNA methylase [Caudoviricetes sp.]
MIFCHSFFILTFSRRKYLGFASFNILTNSKNNFERGSLKFRPLPALENHWQGLPPIRRSIGHISFSAHRANQYINHHL